MKISSMNSALFAKSDLRLDASYHLSEGPMAIKKLSKSPYPVSSLKEECSRIFSGNIFKRTYVSSSEFGIPYLTGSDMVKANIDGGKFLSKKYTGQVDNLMIHKDWILISCSGTLGNTVFTNDDFEGRIGTHDLIRAIPNENNTKKGYLYAYLASKIGYALLTQSSYGGVVKHIEPHHIKDLPIPILPEAKQQEIHDLIEKAADLRVKANELLRGAHELITNIYTSRINNKFIKNSSVSIKKIISSGQQRFDPPVYASKGVQLIESLKKNNFQFKTLKELNVKIHRPGIFKRVYTSNSHGFPYLPGSETFQNDPFKECKYVSKKRTPFIDELVLKKDEILLMCAGSSSVGMVKLITKEYEDKKSLGSQDIIRIYPSENINYGYLFAFLSLPLMFDYIKSFKYGSAIERLEPFHIMDIPILMVTKNLEQQIHSMIVHYQDMIYKAFISEEKAQNLIEHEIDSWQKS